MKYLVIYRIVENMEVYTCVRELKQDESGEWIAHDDSENDLFFHLHDSGSWEYCGYNWYDNNKGEWIFFPDDNLDFKILEINEEEITDSYGSRYYNGTVKEDDKVSSLKVWYFIDRFGTERIHGVVRDEDIEFVKRNGKLVLVDLCNIIAKQSAEEFYKELCFAVYGDRNKNGGGIMSAKLIAEHLGVGEHFATEYLWACARYGITERQGGAWVV